MMSLIDSILGRAKIQNDLTIFTDNFRVKGEIDTTLSTSELLYLTPENNKNGKIAISSHSIIAVEFSSQNELLSILGMDKNTASESETEDFKAAYPDLTRLFVKKHLAKINEAINPLAININFDEIQEDEQDNSFYNTIQLLDQFKQLIEKQLDDSLFQEAAKDLQVEIHYNAEIKELVKRDNNTMMIKVLSNTFYSKKYFENLYDQFEKNL